ncbi:ATPase component of ABC transporters with duplicated ATPase domains [Planctomycetales bacterium 10988]|nr:ATPase component of ABC transporters with duplicated ATPase domains [Planctomycetales bacterium 10988]
MILLTAEQIRKQYGPEPVLEEVTFDLRAGERVGLIGPNGAGKTTLFNIVAGLDEPDAGTLQTATQAKIALLEQHPHFDPEVTVWDVAKSALQELIDLQNEAEAITHQMAAAKESQERKRLADRFDFLQHQLQQKDAYALDHKVERILSGLGFPESQYQQKAVLLSGGQQNRLLLAKLLLTSPDLMLLDEPSNHLDLEATQWLENYLVDSQQAVFVVSHDRYFLDKVCQRTLELYHGTVDDFKGNYTAYKKQKAERLLVQQRTYEKQQEFIAKTEDFIRRNNYGQKHAQAEDRKKKLERLERVELPREIQAPPMGLTSTGRPGDIVLRVENLTKSFDHPLFENLTFEIERGQRWGILGPNGCGKSTLLKCIVGNLQQDEGTIRLGANVELGYFDQQLSILKDDLPVVEAIRPPGKPFTEPQRREMLAKFGITGEMVFQPVSSLSGGERGRSALARLAASDINFLVLDEPTNHLDLWARGALEKSLTSYEGTVLFVSHDRYFLNEVATHLLIVEPGRFRVIEGNYETYQHFIKQGLAQEAIRGNSKTSTKEKDSSSKKSKQEKNEKITKRKRQFPYRKVEDIEKEIFEVESKLGDLQAEFGNEELYQDGDKVKDLQDEVDDLQDHLSQLYEHWEEANELN